MTDSCQHIPKCCLSVYGTATILKYRAMVEVWMFQRTISPKQTSVAANIRNHVNAKSFHTNMGDFLHAPLSWLKMARASQVARKTLQTNSGK